MRYEINLQNELTKQGLYFPRAVVPEADRSAPRFWIRYDSGPWESITPERGSQVMRRDDAVRRAIMACEEHDADAVEVADKPLDGSVYYAEGLPPRKATTRREVMIPRRWRPERVVFRSVERTLWAWGRTGTAVHDICEPSPNGGVGEVTWQCPRDIDIDTPAELQDAAPDRVREWESIVARMLDSQLESTLAADIDAAKLSKAALKTYRETFREAELPPVVAAWSEPAQAIWRRVHEAICAKGADRHGTAVVAATRAVAAEVARQIEAGERAI